MTEIEVQFTSHSKYPWGFGVSFKENWNSWNVTFVNPGDQADKKRIGVGWKVIGINKEKLNEKNFQEFKDLLMKGPSCTIQFRRPTSNIIY